MSQQTANIGISANSQLRPLPRYQDMSLFDESFYQISDPSRPVSTAVGHTRPARPTRNIDSVSIDSALQSSSAASSDYRLPTSLYEFRESQSFAPTVAAPSTTTTRNFFDSAATGTSPHDSIFGEMTAVEIEEVDRAYGLESLLQLVEMGFPAKHGRIALKRTNGNVQRAITFCIEHDARQMEEFILADARGEVISPPEPVTVISSSSPNALQPPSPQQAAPVAAKSKGGVSGLLRSVFKKSGSQKDVPPAIVVAQQQQSSGRAIPAPAAAIAAHPPASSSATTNTFRIPAMNPGFVAANSNPPRVVAPVGLPPPSRNGGVTDVLTTVQEPEWEDFHLFPELATTAAVAAPSSSSSSAAPVTSTAVAAPSVNVIIAPAPVVQRQVYPVVPAQLRGLDSSSSEYGALTGTSFSLSTVATESLASNTPHISIVRRSLDGSRVESFVLMDTSPVRPDREGGDVFDEPFVPSLVTPPLPAPSAVIHEQAMIALAQGEDDDDQAVAVATVIEESGEQSALAEEALNTIHSTSFIIEGEATIISAAVVVAPPLPPLPVIAPANQGNTTELSLTLASTSEGNEGLPFSEFASPDATWTPAAARNDGAAVNASFDTNIFGSSKDPFAAPPPPPPPPLPPAVMTVAASTASQKQSLAARRELPQLPTIQLEMPTTVEAAFVAEEPLPEEDDEIEEEEEEGSFNGDDNTNSSTTSFTAAVATAAAASAPPRPPSTHAPAPILSPSSSLQMLALSEEEEAFIRDGHISVHANNIITDFTVPITPFPRRKLNAYFTDQLPNGMYRAIVVLKQAKLKANESSPQGNRADQIILSDCHTQQMAQDLCEVFAPPIWAGKHDEKDCSLCKTKFSMFSAPHHCRNCGHLVCNSCSDKLWPGHMLPRTFHNNEKIVRVCHSCHFLLENFIVALREGDFNKAQSIYASGNVNLHQPYAAYMASTHAVHLAAAGGNLNLLKWLIDNKRCPIVEKTTKLPVTTQSGLSVLAIAAQAGHAEIIRYLVHEKGCVVTEIQDVLALQRALHALLEAPGPLPTSEANAKGMSDDLLFPLPPKNATSTSSTATAAAVTAALTGPSSPTANAAWTSATAREAPVLMMNSNVYAAPAFVNTMGVAASPDLPLNGLTNSTLAKQTRYRFLASQAVFMVNEFLETQRRALMYAVPLSTATATSSSVQQATSPSAEGTVRIAMASAVPVTNLLNSNTSNDGENVNIVTVQAVPATRGGGAR